MKELSAGAVGGYRCGVRVCGLPRNKAVRGRTEGDSNMRHEASKCKLKRSKECQLSKSTSEKHQRSTN